MIPSFGATFLRCAFFEPFLYRSKDSTGNSIPCVYVKASCQSRFTVLYSHANAEDIGYLLLFVVYCIMNRMGFFLWMSKNLFVDVIGYDYPGYGLCE